MRVLKYVIFAFLAILLVGCGGSGGNFATPSVAISWPDLGRAVNAPTYAGSALITLQSTVYVQPEASWVVDRPSSSVGKTISYKFGSSIKTGPYVLTVSFYSGSGASGSPVALAISSVRVDTNGNLTDSAGGPLGNIAYAATFNSISLDIQSVSKDQTKKLVATGLSNGLIVALPQDQVAYSIVENPQNASISNGSITGLKEGDAKVQMTLDSITGSSSIRVLPKIATYSLIAQSPNHIAYDSSRGKLWATFGPDSQFPNSIVDISPFNGSIGQPIPVGSNPNEITVSSDGSVAYVGLDGASSVVPVNLNSRSAGSPISIQNPSFSQAVNISSIAINPSDSTEIAVCATSQGTSEFLGPYVYRNGVNVGTQQSYDVDHVAYTSSNTLIAISRGTSPTWIRTFDISTNSITMSGYKVVYLSGNSLRNYSLGVIGNLAYLGLGMVFYASNLDEKAELGLAGEYCDDSTSDSTNDIIWTIGQFGTNPFDFDQNYNIRAYETSNFTVTDSVCLPSDVMFGKTYIQLVRFGNKGIAVLTTDGILVIPNGPGL